MAESFKQCEFFLLRYVPDAVKDEFVNIGVVMFEANGAGWADVRFTRDWRRVRCLDPDADIDMLQALEAEIRGRLSQTQERERVLHLLRDSFSNTIQLSPVKACLAAAPQQEIGRLAEMYLETTRGATRREHAGRGLILGRMREAFQRVGVWDHPFMRRRIAAAKFTYKGDPLRIDCGYQPNGVIRMFHAVSLSSDVDAAKVLAFSYPQIREGLARVDNLQSELTAIVEDGLNRGDEAIGFALQTMERNAILIAPLSQLDDIAETARRDLRL